MPSSFTQPLLSNARLQLTATAVASGVVVAGVILTYQRLQKKERLERLKKSIPDPASERRDDRSPHKGSYGGVVPLDNEDAHNEALARRALSGDFDDELILEQLARNRVFLGDEALARLRGAFVVVVGCGGVGSHCATALARSGVARLRLVDFDQVTLSSLNRHAVATLADVGVPKVHCLRRRLLAVAPWVRFDTRLAKFDSASAAALLGPWEEEEEEEEEDGEEREKDAGRRPDFVVDAIDNINTKVELLEYCSRHGLPVISSMGAGTKSDPTRIMVGDIGTSTDDGLSRATRRRLKLRGITGGIPAVYSTEKMGEGKAELLPLPEEEFQRGAVGDLSVLPDFRVRILPVLGTMPAVFGYTLANHVILSIAGYPVDYVPGGKGRDKMYDGILNFVQSSEEKLARAELGGPADVAIGLKVPVTPGDVAFLVEELYGGRSVVTGIHTRLVLLRWRKPATSTLVRIGEGSDEQKSSNVRLRDLVCMTKEEALRHQKEVLQGDRSLEEVYGPSVIESVEAKTKLAEAYEKYR